MARYQHGSFASKTSLAGNETLPSICESLNSSDVIMAVIVYTHLQYLPHSIKYIKQHIDAKDTHAPHLNPQKLTATKEKLVTTIIY